MAAGQGGERPPLAGKTTKKVAFTVLAGLLGCLVILGGLEAYLRIGVRRAGGVQGKELWRTSLVRIADDPEINFENIPCPECNCPINSMGFRGQPFQGDNSAESLANGGIPAFSRRDSGARRPGRMPESTGNRPIEVDLGTP